MPVRHPSPPEVQINAPPNEAEAQEMLQKLTRHYGEPVMPVSRYCDKLRIWAHTVTGLMVSREMVKHIEGALHKSNLAARLLYGDVELRTEKCPVHDGHWSGVPIPDDYCPHGCQHTGWLPNKPKTPEVTNS